MGENYSSLTYIVTNLLTVESSPARGDSLKERGKGKLTPVINLVSKITFILLFFFNRRAYTIEYEDI